MAKKKPIYDGRIISLAVEEHRLPDGRTASFEIVRHPGGAAVLPLLEDGRIVLLRQFRPAVSAMVWEIPAGRLERGELPEDCAVRELQEEAGFLAGSLEKLGTMLTAVGFCDEVLHLYLARDLVPAGPAPEDDEFFENVPLPLGEALRLISCGEITDGKTQLALLLFAGLRRHLTTGAAAGQHDLSMKEASTP
jgi:ADP-ribose pyrophosphatase